MGTAGATDSGAAARPAGDKKEQKNYEKQQSFGNSSVVV